MPGFESRGYVPPEARVSKESAESEREKQERAMIDAYFAKYPSHEMPVIARAQAMSPEAIAKSKEELEKEWADLRDMVSKARQQGLMRAMPEDVESRGLVLNEHRGMLKELETGKPQETLKYYTQKEMSDITSGTDAIFDKYNEVRKQKQAQSEGRDRAA